MITKDSIETAYSFLHQKQRIYVLASLRWQASKARAHSTLDWQRDDIELAISDYANDMSQVIGLPLRSSKNCMMSSVATKQTSFVTTKGFRRISSRLSRYLKRCYNDYDAALQGRELYFSYSSFSDLAL